MTEKENGILNIILEKVTNMEIDICGLKKDVADLKEKVTSLDKKVADLDKRVTSLECSMVKMEYNVTNEIKTLFDAFATGEDYQLKNDERVNDIEENVQQHSLKILRLEMKDQQTSS